MGAGLHGLRALAVALGALLFLALFHTPLLRDPGATLFRGSGDGLKNYFAFGYHLKHDSSYMQFEGMNHPFGEQIGYVDAQPALVNAVKLASKLFPALQDEGVAIINLAVLLGLLLTAVALYLLLSHFGVHWAYAGLGGIALMALSPQVLRMEAAHHGLTYGWTIVLPVLFYLRVRNNDDPWRPALFGVLLMLLGFYLHPYTGMIALCLLGVVVLLDRPLHLLVGDRQRALATAVLLLVPVLLFLLLQGLTDHHVGRTEKPLGFFDYRADRHSILTPFPGYRSPLSQTLVPLDGPQEFEGTTYLGLGAFLAAGLLLLVLLLGRVRPALADRHVPSWPRQLTLLIIGGMVLLAFATGAPFSAAKGWLPWSVPFVGQFRSPGRFGWAGYYMFGVAAFYLGWWLMQHARGPWRVAALVFAGAVPALYLYEAVYYHEPTAAAIYRDRNVLDTAQLFAHEQELISAIEPGRYRALAVVPHFLNGSDELLLQPDERALELGMLMAYHSGVPLLSYSMARSSIPETVELLGVFNAPWYPRPIAERFAPDDEFLLVLANTPANVHEADHFARAEPVLRSGDVELRRISASTLFADRTEELFQRLEAARLIAPPHQGWYGPTAEASLYHESFDTAVSPLTYHGRGAFAGVHGVFNEVASVPPNTLTAGEHIASFWVYNKGPLKLHTLVCITQLEDGAPQDAWISCGDTRHSRIVNGDWSLFEIRFNVDRPQDHYGIKLKGADYYTDTITIDEVLIRPAESEVFRVLEEREGRIRRVHYNGHYLTRPE